MSNPQDRAPSKKRPLSPSTTPGPSSAWPTSTTSRKTSRPNHEVSSAARETIPNLDSQQLRDVINQLVNFHPSARETIRNILPTLKPSQPAVVQKNKESIHFKRQVDRCAWFLSDNNWVRHPATTRADACDSVSRVVGYELLSIQDSITNCNSRRNHCEEDYFVDAAIALLDIGLLFIKRTKRLATPSHRYVACSCVCVECSPTDDCDNSGYCPAINNYYSLYKTLRKVRPYLGGMLRDGEGGDSDDEEEDSDDEKDNYIPRELESSEDLIRAWFKAVGYATSDGCPHFLRFVILKYIKLPPMLPYHSPNAQPINLREPWLFDALRSVDRVLRTLKLPEAKHDIVPEINGLSIEEPAEGGEIGLENGSTGKGA